MDDEAVVALMQGGLVETIGRLGLRVQPPVKVLSFELYPWHSYMALSVADATTPADARSPADWRLFEVAHSNDLGMGAEVVEAWHRVAVAMNTSWNAACEVAGKAASLTDHYHRLAARAIRSSEVRHAIAEAGWGEPELQVINVDDPDARNYATP